MAEREHVIGNGSEALQGDEQAIKTIELAQLTAQDVQPGTVVTGISFANLDQLHKILLVNLLEKTNMSQNGKIKLLAAPSGKRLKEEELPKTLQKELSSLLKKIPFNGQLVNGNAAIMTPDATVLYNPGDQPETNTVTWTLSFGLRSTGRKIIGSTHILSGLTMDPRTISTGSMPAIWMKSRIYNLGETVNDVHALIQESRRIALTVEQANARVFANYHGGGPDLGNRR